VSDAGPDLPYGHHLLPLDELGTHPVYGRGLFSQQKHEIVEALPESRELVRATCTIDGAVMALLECLGRFAAFPGRGTQGHHLPTSLTRRVVHVAIGLSAIQRLSTVHQMRVLESLNGRPLRFV